MAVKHFLGTSREFWRIIAETSQESLGEFSLNHEALGIKEFQPLLGKVDLSLTL